MAGKMQEIETIIVGKETNYSHLLVNTQGHKGQLNSPFGIDIELHTVFLCSVKLEKKMDSKHSFNQHPLISKHTRNLTPSVSDKYLCC